MSTIKFTNHSQTGRVAWLQRPGALAPACRQAGRLAIMLYQHEPILLAPPWRGSPADCLRREMICKLEGGSRCGLCHGEDSTEL